MADFKNLFNFKGSAGSKETATDKDQGGNQYTDLFGQKNAGGVKSNDGQLMENIVKSTDATNDKSILGIEREPVLDTSTFIDQGYHLKKNLAFVRGMFFLLLFVSVSLLGYFFVDLNSNFDLLNKYIGRNTTQTLNDTNNKIIGTQTKINDFRYRIAKMSLDEFSHLSDQYLQQYTIYNSGADSLTVTEAERNMIDLQGKLAKSFEKAKEKLLAQNWVNYGKPNSTDDEYKAEFIASLQDFFQARKDAEQKSNQKAAEVENIIKETDDTMKLVGNNPLIAAMQSNDFSNLSYKEVKSVIDAVNSSTSNALSYIYKVKKDRMLWSKVIREIDLVTEKTDIYYKTGFFEQAGGIQYSNYQFDSNTGRVVVTGQAKSDNGSNFTLMANLIDEFEKSAMFREVAMRSFAKSGDEEDGYTSTVKLDFSLQKDGVEATDVNNSLVEPLETLSIDNSATKVKRVKQSETQKIKRKK